jgi:polysaccharide biosynthesis protein PslA
LGIADKEAISWILSFYLSGLIVLLAMRLGLGAFLKHSIASGMFTKRLYVLGTGPLAQRFVEHVNAGRSGGLHRVIGVYDDRTQRAPKMLGDVEVLGSIDNLIEVARRTKISEIVIALPLSAEDRLLGIIRRLSVIATDIRILTDSVGFQMPDRDVSHIMGVPLINAVDRPIKEWRAVFKSIEDYVLSLAIGAVALPFLIVIAILIRLDSPGPILFRQQRSGFNGHEFGMYKFRTMYDHMSDPAGSKLTVRNDPRVTSVGRVLRKTSLDELPQILNVLNGTMSIVGPRPHALDARAGDTLYHQAVANYAARHRVKPGITGWAQVNGWRGETDTREKIENRVKCDLYYIENWSLLLDLKILVLTLFRGFTGMHVF